nr:MAG TPA: hypothetical protein [Caudoviricetes sp.]
MIVILIDTEEDDGRDNRLIRKPSTLPNAEQACA